MRLDRIVSGGQTGVDRGALDAALAAGFPCGGWCPAGRLAEDGAISHRYPLRETAQSDYRVRTRRNVEDGDGTLILAPGPLSGGTLLTLEYCRRSNRPCLVVDADEHPPDEAVGLAARWARRHDVRVLNVAGPRASGWEGAAAYAAAVIGGLVALAQSDSDRSAAENSERSVSGGEQVDPRQR